MKTLPAVVAAAAAIMLSGCDAFSDGYNSGFKDQFQKNCVKAAVDGGAPEGLASEMCACTLDKLEAELGEGEIFTPSEQEQLKAAQACMTQRR